MVKVAKKQSTKKQSTKNDRDDHDDHDEDDNDEEVVEDCAKLTIPSSRVTQLLRKKLFGLRFSAENGIFATGAIELVVSAIFKAIKDSSDCGSDTGRSRRADYRALIRAVRTDPDLSRAFAAYVFTPGKNDKLKIHPKIFLNGADQAVYDAKREAEKEARKKAKSVPAVDEE